MQRAVVQDATLGANKVGVLREFLVFYAPSVLRSMLIVLREREMSVSQESRRSELER